MIQIGAFEYFASLVRDYPYPVMFFAVALGVVGVAGLAIGFIRENK